MPSILTPNSIWDSLDDKLELLTRTIKVVKSDDVTIEYINILGRDTGMGRVIIYAALAYSGSTPTDKTLLYLPDSKQGIDESILKLFSKKDYTVLMIDYRGVSPDDAPYTVYPDNVTYANAAFVGKNKYFVDESADKTCWFEWSAAAIYGKKYLEKRTGSDSTAIIGVKDGGEIAWKVITKETFSCAVVISAPGWKYCEGFSKYEDDEPELDEERYRFIAGVDSQAYAPYGKCPVMMLCTVNDSDCDNDRAFDTFSRINEKYLEESAILYSIPGTDFISYEATSCMFLFLDKYIFSRQIFIPEPSEIEICMDDEKNLVAYVKSDPNGQNEHTDLFFAEDELDSSKRFWNQAEFISFDEKEHRLKFSLDIYKETKQIFVFGRTRHSNGFIIWTRIYTKKISGVFRNSQPKCNVLFCSDEYDNTNLDGFTIAEKDKGTCGGLFVINKEVNPEIIVKNDHDGISSPCGISTWKISAKRYAALSDSVLKLDVITDEEADVTVLIYDSETKNTCYTKIHSLGGVWQSETLEPTRFKDDNGTHLTTFADGDKISVCCDTSFAVNNLMWI